MSLLFSTGAIAGSAAKGAPGMVLLTPTSITYSGTSASVGANGQVTFSAVTSLSLNGVFSADFDNYVLSMRVVGSGNLNIRYRWRASGSDDSTANSYTRQFIEADNTAVNASRSTANEGTFNYFTALVRAGSTMNIYGPYLSQPTATRSFSAGNASSAYIEDYVNTHNQSTSYDGITLYPSANNVTGALQVYGVRS